MQVLLGVLLVCPLLTAGQDPATPATAQNEITGEKRKLMLRQLFNRNGENTKAGEDDGLAGEESATVRPRNRLFRPRPTAAPQEEEDLAGFATVGPVSVSVSQSVSTSVSRRVRPIQSLSGQKPSAETTAKPEAASKPSTQRKRFRWAVPRCCCGIISRAMRWWAQLNHSI